MLVLALAALTLVEVPVSDLRFDETIHFFPTWGRPIEDGREWELTVHGWVFEPETNSVTRAAMLGLMRRMLRLEKEDAGTKLFRQRARAFLVDNERGKTIAVRFGEREFRLDPSGPNGHFQGAVRLSADEVGRLAAPDGAATRWLPFSAILPQEDIREFSGRVQMVSEEGLSIVSDIDDTIKISDVRDRQKLLRNTFLREFEAVPGMAGLFARQALRGATFHYVTASPWQLYDPLAEFVETAGFPRGTFHMQLFRVKDLTLLDLIGPHDEVKNAAIEPLLVTFPRRRFILVGDSGERDPEIYGALARKHPGQVERIWIRNVTQEPADSLRFRQAFAGMPPERWSVFDEPDEVDAELPQGPPSR